MAPPPPPPGGRNKTRLIIGAAVGAAVLIGGAIAAGVLLTSENDTGPKGNAKAFIAAYNAASAKASRNHPPRRQKRPRPFSSGRGYGLQGILN